LDQRHAARKKVFAMLVDSLDDEHEVSVVRGAMAAVRELDATLLCVVGGSVSDPDPDVAAKNFAYDPVGPGTAQGALVLSSSICSGLGPDGLKAWLARFAGLPLCCAGVPLDGYPSVTVDNFGLRVAVEHLIRVHGKRSIAFIRGPSTSTEAEDRFASYNAVLAAEGIKPEERWVTEGDYSKESGAQAMRTLFDERRVNTHALDAIVAANDFMAIGALAELTRRNINVPEQLALVGFDDVESTRHCRPALTTVRQQGDRLGREGIHRLAAHAEGRTFDSTLVLPTELVVRRSCGCVPEIGAGLAERSNLPSVGRSVESAFVQRRQIIVAEMARAARGSLGAAGSGWENRLVDALIAELRVETSGELGRVWARILERIDRAAARSPAEIHREGEASVPQDVLGALRRHSLPCVASDPAARDRLEEALHEARSIAALMAAEGATRRERTSSERFRTFARRAQALAFGDETLLSRLAAESLPAMGVDACVVAAFPVPGQVAAEVRTAFGFGSGSERPSGERIRIQDLPAQVSLGGHAQVVLPILIADQPLGLAVLSTVAFDGALFEELRDLFGTMLRVSALRRE
jgi:DNA-binding LacI/PurR family transcriptional regulator